VLYPAVPTLGLRHLFPSGRLFPSVEATAELKRLREFD
jgi:hypothetical protein